MRFLKIAVLALAINASAVADEYFYATAYTGFKSQVSSIVNVTTLGPVFGWYNTYNWYYLMHEGNQYWTGQPAPSDAMPGNPGANISGIASNWNLWYANWTNTGDGYATIDIDTDHPPGAYAVGTMNATGAVIWVILQES